jgi:mono/diheme cytochrome c family protein
MKKVIAMIIAGICSGLSVQPAWASMDAKKLFKSKCSFCHKVDKKGMGPAVIKMTSDAAVLKSAIMNGRGAMPSFDRTLDNEKINTLVEFIQSKQPALNPCAENTSGK